jgi:hypothetical protein
VPLLLPALALCLPVSLLTAFVMPSLTLEIAAVAVAVASVAAAPLPVVPAGTVLGAVTGTCSFGRPTSVVDADAFSAVAVAVAVGVAVAVSGDRRVDRELGQQG